MFRIIRRKWGIKKGQHARSPGAKGQSLVEMAIITPLLLLMAIGALEVGWAIRGYVVLVNADREATRFAARGQYLDFSQTEREDVGYGRVLSHTLTSISEQLPFDVVSDEPNGTLIISHYQVKTGKPCADPPCNDDCAADRHNKNGGCDCSTPDRREPDYPFDDAVVHPGMDDYQHFTALYGISRASHLVHDEVIAELKEQNDAFNCSLNLKDPSVPWATNSVVAVETFYDQPQILGVPIVSNRVTDPVPLYAHTIMRVATDRGKGKGGGNEATGCALLPIIVHEDLVPPKDNTLMDNIREGTGSGNFGWLRWTDDTDVISGNPNSEEYLVEELSNPLLAQNDYVEPEHKDVGYLPPDYPHDIAINTDDWVWGLTGNVNSDGVARTELDRLIDHEVEARIPVWDTSESTGSNVVYHIVGFIRVTLTAHDLGGNPKEISAMFWGWDHTCQ